MKFVTRRLRRIPIRVHIQIAPNRDQTFGQFLGVRKKRRGYRFSFAARQRLIDFRAIALMAVLCAR